MMYWDTSALLKLYVAEDDSGYFIGLIAKIDQAIVCSAISAIEILSALYRKGRNRELSRAAQKPRCRGSGRIRWLADW